MEAGVLFTDQATGLREAGHPRLDPVPDPVGADGLPVGFVVRGHVRARAHQAHVA